MSDEARTALVTGASRGIGAAIALRLGIDGHNVLINYLAEEGRDNATEAADVAEKIRSEGAECLCVAADVTDREAVADMVRSAGDVFGGVDILVNNAGITHDRTMRKLPPEDWDRVIEVNLTGAFNCTRAVLNDMSDRGWGRIISISSVVALA
ncbi:MAG: SDR family NAD(P)-dependent oxidoreductase, partial [Armatimonadota bacterium]